MDGPFDLAGALRRIRRLADLSQRELAARAALSPSTVAHAEAGSRDLPVGSLVRAAGVAGLRLVLVDGAGEEVSPMSPDGVRDLSGRRFPAHLDTYRSDERGWSYEPRRDRPAPWFTYTADRPARDAQRSVTGTPADHIEVRPGDSPDDRRAARRAAALARHQEERARRIAAGESRLAPDWICECPPRCAELDDYSGRPVHAPECPCLCDVG